MPLVYSRRSGEPRVCRPEPLVPVTCFKRFSITSLVSSVLQVSLCAISGGGGENCGHSSTEQSKAHARARAQPRKTAKKPRHTAAGGSRETGGEGALFHHPYMVVSGCDKLYWLPRSSHQTHGREHRADGKSIEPIERNGGR